MGDTITAPPVVPETTLTAPPATPPAKPAEPAAPAAIVPPAEAPKPDAKVPPAAPAAPAAKPESKPGDPPTAPKPPAVYDLKLPDGSLLDKTDIERIVKTAKENEFAPEDAQKLLEAEHEAVKAYDVKQKAQLTEATKTWAEESKNDKEVGGEKFSENAELARRVVTKFGTPQLTKALTETGLGNHPELVRIMVRIGRALGDDQLVVGSAGPTPAAKSPAERLYPTTSKGA